MLDGIDLEDKENVASVTIVIKAVLDGVKVRRNQEIFSVVLSKRAARADCVVFVHEQELVKLTIEKQEQPSPTSPNKPAPPATTAESSVSSEMPSIDREQEVSSKTAPAAAPAEAASDVQDEDVAPPKPPLPEAKMAELSPPPALPPKKRQSAPSPTRVAVVAPMSRGSSLPCSVHRQQQDYEQEFLQRRFSGGSQSYGGDSPRLSPCSSMGKLSKSDEQLSSMEQDSGQCSRNTSCETLDNTENYDPDYDFLHQDLSVGENLPPIPVGGCLSPLPESHSESSSPVPGQHPTHPRFSAPPPQQPPEYWTPQPNQTNPLLSRISAPPALPQKKRRSTQSLPFPDGGSRVLYERFPSHYDNLSEEELHPTPPFHFSRPSRPCLRRTGACSSRSTSPASVRMSHQVHRLCLRRKADTSSSTCSLSKTTRSPSPPSSTSCRRARASTSSATSASRRSTASTTPSAAPTQSTSRCCRRRCPRNKGNWKRSQLTMCFKTPPLRCQTATAKRLWTRSGGKSRQSRPGATRKTWTSSLS
uniref:Uncharacterized protein n=2 Tax=Labrus bergylta TaxID=56723 RepID=A0A3Q3EXR0_9LABR